MAPGAIGTTSLRLPWLAVTVKAARGQARPLRTEAGETAHSRRRRAEDMRMRRRRARGREMSLGFALAPIPQASAVAYGLGYAAALELTARRFPAALSSRAPGTRREKGFLIDRAEALRSTELAIRQVGWDGGHMPCYYRAGRSVAQSSECGTGCGAMPDGEGPWILCTRVGLADGLLGPKGGLHPRFPGPSSEPNGDGRRASKCGSDFGCPLRQQWLGMGGSPGGRQSVGQARDGGNSRLVYVFPCVHMRHGTRR